MSHSLFSLIEAICYFFVIFRALSQFFHSSSGVCYTFHLHSSSDLCQRKKIQVSFVCVDRRHGCMSTNDTVKVPTVINGLSLWWILRFTFFCRDSPENQSIIFPASLLLLKTMVFKTSLNQDNSFHCPKIGPRQWQFCEFMFWHSTLFISPQSVV